MSLLAENVRRLIEASYLSIDDVAKKAGLNRCTIMNTMNDRHNPHEETVERLADVFKVSKNSL